jgi:hypothetical protein
MPIVTSLIDKNYLWGCRVERFFHWANEPVGKVTFLKSASSAGSKIES